MENNKSFLDLLEVPEIKFTSFYRNGLAVVELTDVIAIAWIEPHHNYKHTAEITYRNGVKVLWPFFDTGDFNLLLQAWIAAKEQSTSSFAHRMPKDV